MAHRKKLLSTRSVDRIALVVIPLSIILVALIFLRPYPAEFPMDDTYIHFVYAENLAETGKLFFNNSSEIGVGTSSILWVMLLSSAYKVGIPVYIAAKALGIISLVVLGIALYFLLRSIFPVVISLAAALLVVLSGHFIWFSLSGMETVLFLSIGILALLSYREKHWIWLGILLGLLTMTRSEGIVLLFIIAAFDIWKHRSLQKSMLTSALICALICLPWFIYLWVRTGFPLPTSGMGKHFTNSISIQVAVQDKPALAWLGKVPWLTYPFLWVVYMVEFILGGFALPDPSLTIPLGIGPFSYKLSIWAILGIIVVVIPLFWVSLRRLIQFIRMPGWIKNESHLPVIIFLVWVILNNLVYVVYLPMLGTASRYASLNHIALWIGLAVGVWYLRKEKVYILLAIGVAAIAVANTVYWDKVYEANIEHMQNVRIAAAKYIRDQVPRDRVCAASDIGAVRYYGDRPIVDLGGLIEPGLYHWFLEGKSDQYLYDHGVTCLILPGRAGTNEDGVYDIASLLGVTQSKLFSLDEQRVFQIDRDRWLLGYYPVVNSQATVTIYSLDPNQASSGE
jgi:hypothetical protein